MLSGRFLLTLSCSDRPGIVAAVTTAMAGVGANIVQAQQFDDRENGLFFMRVTFDVADPAATADDVRAALADPAERFALRYVVRERSELQRVLILVSRFDHCLVDILYRWRIGELPMEIVGIVSNHPRSCFAAGDLDAVPFHYLPVTAATKIEQEARLTALIEDSGADLVVLARYMQILSDDLSRKLSGRCINIHHSFLPGFKGAKPYHQAHARGVKLIGATAHYVTADLDEGPIIEQDVERISHDDSAEELVAKGRDIERRVLARALSWHLDGRVFRAGNKTIVFRS